jgi:hypothetical protein
MSVILIGRLRSGRYRFKANLDKQFARPHLQNNQSKMDWQCGSDALKGPALKA